MIRVHRSAAGREALSAAERLMDGLLREEERAAEVLTAEVRALTTTVEAGILALHRRAGQAGVVRAGTTRLPVTVRGMVEPPVGDLLAVTRTRTVETVRRQLRACQDSVGQQWPGLAKQAAAAAESVAPELERSWLGWALDGAEAHWRVILADAAEQMSVWTVRKEPPDALVARWCSPTPTNLPGCGRGVLWGLVPAVVELARRASVATVSGLLLAGYEGWNVQVDAAEAS